MTMNREQTATVIQLSEVIEAMNAFEKGNDLIRNYTSVDLIRESIRRLQKGLEYAEEMSTKKEEKPTTDESIILH